ncbi:hypothetical protein LRM64_10195 [Prescottella equi]|uniref:hypothetical protein n=1 Tax=Rhodococcus hoagii TaxID=43767 RepID=UPI0019E42485|nr:hypothetical protein [Prescottella equi]MBM4592267.1 hypothetical protein [Prescottella equi]MBM4596133.1 hypothetical protein [Prescottella equi]MCU7531917.1 hypothetical protein [Prescottella equi]MCU7534049.1 hypothetical protein [Prescottella equi]NKW12981.1 hypothetical protein [Prescottella equi]
MSQSTAPPDPPSRRTTAYLYDGDLDAILENITTPPAKARVLVDHYSSLADRFVGQFTTGLIDGLS